MNRYHSLFSLLAAVAVLGSTGCRAAKDQSPDRPLAVRAVEVRLGPMHDELRYVGTLRSRQEVQIPARIAGTVREMAAEGERLEAGEPLLRIAAPEMDARAARARAEAERAAAEADFHCRNYARDTELAEAGAVSAFQLDTARRQCETARSASLAARAATNEADTLRSLQMEKAPFRGTVLKHLVEPRTPVMPGQPLLIFGDDEVEISVEVSEEDLGEGIVEGLSVRIDTGAEFLQGHVRAIAPRAGGPARTTEVRVTAADGAPPALRNGMSVDVGFVLAHRTQAAAVPMRALRSTGEGHAVFVITGDRVVETQVQTGIRADGWVEVSPALPAGSRVAATNVGALVDGMRVLAVDVSEAP